MPVSAFKRLAYGVMKVRFRQIPLSPSELAGGCVALAVVGLIALFGLGIVQIPALPPLSGFSSASIQLPRALTGSSGGQASALSDSKAVAPEPQTYRLASEVDDQKPARATSAKTLGSALVYTADAESSDRSRPDLLALPAILTQAQTAEATGPPSSEMERSPLNRSDAMWIQERLHDLGYFSGNRDGVWDAASRNALHDFKSMNGLSPDDRWDKQTEQRLSSGRGIRADSTFIGGWATDIDQCQGGRQHGAPIVITSRAAETASSKCTFRSITREVATSWRVTAMCSAGGNSWAANLQLRLTTANLTLDRMLEPATESTRVVGKHTDIEYARFADDLVISTEQGTGRYVRCPVP
jgi:Putative peptidoglycan binding domain